MWICNGFLLTWEVVVPLCISIQHTSLVSVLLLHSGTIVLKTQFFRSLCILRSRSTFICMLKIFLLKSLVWVLKTQCPCLIIESRGEQGHPGQQNYFLNIFQTIHNWWKQMNEILKHPEIRGVGNSLESSYTFGQNPVESQLYFS
jgi:hypothetical protein